MKTDLSQYTVKALQAMCKDLGGIKGYSKMKRPELQGILGKADLSSLDLDSYEKLMTDEEKEAKSNQAETVKKPVSRRRSANGRNFGRR